MDIRKEIERIDKLSSIINAIQHFDAKIKIHQSTLRQINGNFPVLINKINNDIDTCERVIYRLQVKFYNIFKN